MGCWSTLPDPVGQDEWTEGWLQKIWYILRFDLQL